MTQLVLTFGAIFPSGNRLGGHPAPHCSRYKHAAGSSWCKCNGPPGQMDSPSSGGRFPGGSAPSWCGLQQIATVGGSVRHFRSGRQVCATESQHPGGVRAVVRAGARTTGLSHGDWAFSR